MQFHLTGVLMKREGRDTDAQRDDRMGTQGGDGHSMPRREATEGPC